MQMCTICKHNQREFIDRAIIERASERTIAARFGISKTADAGTRRKSGNWHESISRKRAETVANEITRAEDRIENLYIVAENVLKAR